MADDARDERIAQALEVERLDELTRRRLVAGAMAAAAPASAPRNPARWFAAAAAILVIALGVVALVALPGNDDADRPSAAAPAASPPRDHAPLTQSAAPSADRSSPSSAANDARPGATSGEVPGGPDVASFAGDFGDLAKAANRRRLLAAVFPDAETRAAASDADPAAAADAAAALAALPCAATLPDGTVTATATGRFGDREAVVVVTRGADGTLRVDAVLADPCEVRPLG
jgi:hypothetical protein